MNCRELEASKKRYKTMGNSVDWRFILVLFDKNDFNVERIQVSTVIKGRTIRYQPQKSQYYHP
jgi:hypothetical protein